MSDVDPVRKTFTIMKAVESIDGIMEEYYRLTSLNWSSLFKQGKYVLPQILTQKVGENIFAGVRVPDDMNLL